MNLLAKYLLLLLVLNQSLGGFCQELTLVAVEKMALIPLTYMGSSMNELAESFKPHIDAHPYLSGAAQLAVLLLLIAVILFVNEHIYLTFAVTLLAVSFVIIRNSTPKNDDNKKIKELENTVKEMQGKMKKEEAVVKQTADLVLQSKNVKSS